MKNQFFRILPSVLLAIYMAIASPREIRAQTFQVDTVLYNGDPSKFINCVFLGDGFQSTEFASYASNVQALTNYLFNITPFKEYVNYFNVFAIEVPSVESGADHPRTAPDCPPAASHPLLAADTYFNSSFDQNNIHRLLVPLNGTAIWTVLLNNFPQYDQKLILVNTPYYGGSGGSNATSSLHSSAFEIMVHEIGHSFASLGDEYWAGDGYAGEKVNMTQEINPALVKWKNWIGTGGVGIYQHCCGGTSANWYRPHQGCKMRYLGTSYPFCPVCTEVIIEKIHQKFGTPVISSMPADDTLAMCGQTMNFSIYTIRPVPNTMRVIWALNNDTILKNSDSVSIDTTQLIIGLNELKVIVMDTTPLSRSDAHYLNGIHTYTLTWVIKYAPVQAPVISPGGPATICVGDTLSLASSPAAGYQWNTGDTLQSIAVTGVGNYTVTVTDGNGCTAAAQPVEIAVNPLPTAHVSTGGPTAFCSGDSVVLTADACNQYLWSDSSSAQTVTVISSGSYSVTVTDSNGCSAASADITVTVHPMPAAFITPAGPLSICTGDSVTLVPNAANAYLWSDSSAGQNLTVFVSGMYSVSITDSNACTAVSPEVSVTVHPLPPQPIIAAVLAQLSSDAPSGNQWYFNGNPIPGANAQTYEVTQNGIYTVCVTDINVCVSCSDPFDFVTVNLQEWPGDQQIQIIPNPNNGRFSIIIPQEGGAKIHICDLMGRSVFSEETSSGQVEPSLQPAGIYFVQVLLKNTIAVRVLVIE